MIIRQATVNDLDRMVVIDKKAYGKYGASKKYIAKKMTVFPEGVLVVKDGRHITGFTVCEFLEKDALPGDFADMNLVESINGRWMHPVMFTTTSNYKDKKSDSKLILAAEKVARRLGCVESCVPLSINHPFAQNGVFKFWEMNGYKNIGKIKWIPTSGEFIECYFYKKSLK